MNRIIKITTASLKHLLIILCFTSLTLPEIFAQGDNCANALVLNDLSSFCSANGSYTTVGATTSANPTPGCWGSASNDVWFQFTAMATDLSLTINGNTVNANGTLTNPNLALYSGTCATLTQLSCAVVGLTANAVTLYNSALIVANTYYIRVNGSNAGTF